MAPSTEFSLWSFLQARSEVPLHRVMAVASLSGLANATLIAVINSAAHEVAADGLNTQKFFLFLIAITIYVLTQRYILQVSTIEVEKIIAKIRISLSDRIRRADLHAMETLGRAQLYASLNNDTLTISRATAPMIIASQGALLVVFSLGYIWYLEPTAFALTLAIVAIGIALHFKNKKQLAYELAESSAKENELFDVVTHLLDGFKEVKLNSARNRDLYEHLRGIAVDAAELKTRSGIRYAHYYLFTQVMFLLLLAAMVFILPELSANLVEPDQVTSITAAVLFIIGPLTTVVASVPVFRTATHAVQNMANLEAALDRAQQLARDPDNGEVVTPPDFHTIEVRGVTFSHRDKAGRPLFTLGPVSCTITRGETILTVGGNGSGKSTFFKLLTGLYYPDTGTILIDGVDVKTIGDRRYRELFSAVFTDYHLFTRLYGLNQVDDRRVDELLRLMQLEGKTAWRDGRFVNQELSTGQKKRLALIVSLLEDKPIYVFDEWAADQDPAFRKFFYDTLLPDLKAQGKTVIAATHDDRYFYAGDRVLKMEMGQFVAGEGLENA
ncbi:MAG: cyclic peptide export ABC transporter [Acidobacteriota bacterium]|nr:cyclic peptide export ABC transporter [Acidobacteriota bacterium]